MRYRFLYENTYPMLECEIYAGEEMIAESDAIVMMSKSVMQKGSEQARAMRTISKRLQSESFFVQRITTDKVSGTVLLAQAFPGTIETVSLAGQQLFIRKECFLAAAGTPQISYELLRFNAKGDVKDSFAAISICGNENVFFGGYGAVHKIDLNNNDEIIIDYNHLIAWEAHINYTFPFQHVERSEYGENRLCKFFGQGSIWLQSRNGCGFKHWLSEIE